MKTTTKKDLIQAPEEKKDKIIDMLSIDRENIVFSKGISFPVEVDENGRPVPEFNEKTQQWGDKKIFDLSQFNVCTNMPKAWHIGLEITLIHENYNRQSNSYEPKSAHNVAFLGIKDQEAYEKLKKLPEFADAFGDMEESRVGADDKAEDVGF